MLVLVKFKKGIKKLNNKNICFVKIRADRQCYFCGSTIPEGRECLTINSKNRGRNWLCISCLRLKLQLNAEKSSLALKGIPFDDEGGFIAEAEYIRGVYSDLIARCIDKGEADRLVQEFQNYR